MPSISCSSRSRSNIRFTVCRCLRGASRSALSTSSIAGLNASRRERRGGGLLRGAGKADDSASRTVRRWTPYLRANARTDKPDIRESRRIAAYISISFGAIRAPSTLRARQCSHPNRPGGAKTRWNRSPPMTAGATADCQVGPDNAPEASGSSAT